LRGFVFRLTQATLESPPGWGEISWWCKFPPVLRGISPHLVFVELRITIIIPRISLPLQFTGILSGHSGKKLTQTFLFLQTCSYQSAAKLVTRILEEVEDGPAVIAFRKYVRKRFLKILEAFEDGQFLVEMSWKVVLDFLVLIIGVFFEREGKSTRSWESL
jgi:hypothetical protein